MTDQQSSQFGGGGNAQHMGGAGGQVQGQNTQGQGVPMPPPIQPVVPAPIPQSMPVVPTPPVGGGQPVVAPQPQGSAPPAKPKKPMTLEDLAKQTPIFSDAELEEDDFDPWAPLDDNKFEESSDPQPVQSDPLPSPVQSVPPEPVAPKVPMPEPVAPAPDLHVETEEGQSVDMENEVIEGDLVDDDIDPFDGIEPDEEVSPIQDFLQKANIDSKKVMGCIVVFFVMIVIIIGLIFGGKALYGFLTADRMDEEEVKEEVQEEMVKEKEVEKESVTKEMPNEINDLPEGWIAPSLFTGLRAGEDAAVENTPHIPGVGESSTILGSENLVVYVTTLKQIRDVYEIDINLFLDSSTDRRGTVNGLISQMKLLHQAAIDAIPQVEMRQLEIQGEFDRVTAEKQVQEDLYFVTLNNNDGIAADRHLNNFIRLARESVDFRARYRALDEVRELLVQYASALDTRIRDVELNREALVKGVRVVDVEGSDIDLIIPESSL